MTAASDSNSRDMAKWVSAYQTILAADALPISPATTQRALKVANELLLRLSQERCRQLAVSWMVSTEMPEDITMTLKDLLDRTDWSTSNNLMSLAVDSVKVLTRVDALLNHPSAQFLSTYLALSLARVIDTTTVFKRFRKEWYDLAREYYPGFPKQRVTGSIVEDLVKRCLTKKTYVVLTTIQEVDFTARPYELAMLVTTLRPSGKEQPINNACLPTDLAL